MKEEMEDNKMSKKVEAKKVDVKEEEVSKEEPTVEKAEVIVKEKPVVKKPEVVKEKSTDKRTEFVKKVELDSIIKKFGTMKSDYKSVIKESSLSEGKLSDAFQIIKQKDLMIKSYQKKLDVVEKTIAQFEQEKIDVINERQQARFVSIFDKYCKFHKIPENERGNTRKELATLSESVLETIDRDMGRAMNYAVSEPEIIPNSQEFSSVTVKEELKGYEELSPKEKTEALFKKLG